MLRQVQGNARTCVFMEPLFVVPYNMFVTYASVYMLHLHVSTEQVGLITTISAVLQIFSAAVSGYLTDRMGRRKALWVFDVISWSIGTLVWTFAQNLWWFVAATILNSVQRIPATAWYCLLVEDTEPANRTFVFRGLQIVGLIGGLFAPVAGLLVTQLTLVPAVRCMYMFACVSMSAMIYFRHRGMHETETGLRKMREHQQVTLSQGVRDYGRALQNLVQSPALLMLFLVYVLWNFQATVSSTFLPIYEINHLHIHASLISWFPAFSSITMMILFRYVLPKLQEEKAKDWMIIGFGLLIVSTLLLIFTPSKQFWLLVIVTIFSAAGTIIANPYLESVVANAIDDNHRATFLSVLNVLILVFTSPAGILGGWTYTVDARLTFVLVLTAFVISILLTATVRTRTKLA